MATNVTSDNFDEFLAIGLQQWGIATEQADVEDVPVVTSIGPNDSPAYSMPMAKEFCVSKLMKSPKMNLVICNGNYVKYDVRREGNAVIFSNRDSNKETTIMLR